MIVLWLIQLLCCLLLSRSHAKTFDALPRPLAFSRDAQAQASSSCDQDTLLRAFVAADLLPSSNNSWAVTLAATPSAVSGYLLQLGRLRIRRDDAVLVVEDAASIPTFTSAALPWGNPNVTVSIFSAPGGTVTLCVGATAVSTATLRSAKLSSGITLGDVSSFNSIPGTYSSLFVSSDALTSCSQAAALFGPRPAAAAAAAAAIILLDSSKGTQLFIGERTVFRAAAAHSDSSGDVKVLLTAFGVPAEQCVTAECGDLQAVRVTHRFAKYAWALWLRSTR
jgi:hypothetical protein